MILLTGTAHLLRVVTGSAGASVVVQAEWLENNAGDITPDSQSTPAITTATTTTIVPAPTSGKSRNVGQINVTNNHATQATRVTVEHFDGTTAIPLMGVTLLPGENLALNETGRWVHKEVQGAAYVYTPPTKGNLGPTGSLAETMPRESCLEDIVTPSSGTLWLQAIYLYAGQVINNIILSSATFAVVTPTNGAAGIYSQARNLLAWTADQLTTAWAANTVKTLALTAPYLVQKTELHYIGFYIKATDAGSFKGLFTNEDTALRDAYFQLGGPSNGALTTALPQTALAPGGTIGAVYAAVS